MDINFKLQYNDDNSKEQQRVKDAVEKKRALTYQPTWEEVWVTGYTSHTGALKIGILQSKLSEIDNERVIEVKRAIESGEIGTYVDGLSKFTKAHALRLYKLLIKQRKEATIRKMIEEKPENYILIQNVSKLQKLIDDLKDEKVIGLDTETTGVEEADRIVGLSMTLPKADYHVYIPIRHRVKDKQLPCNLVLSSLKSALEDKALGKVLHNAKFDVHMFRKEGIRVQGIIMDTMIGMGILNENEPSYALKNLATKYGKHFGFEDKSSTYEELFGKGGFQDTPLDIATVYACKDTHLTYMFYEWILNHMKRVSQLMSVYYDIENPILEVCIEMEKNGFLIDMEFAKKYKENLKSEVLELEQQLQEYFDGININSPTQLAKKLYDDIGLEDVSGKRSVDASTLGALKKKHEGISILLKYRELNKLLTTYIEPLPQKVLLDGRLHGQFNQTATVTGRFASRTPNLQNLPPEARKLIIAPEGKLIIGIDFSQIEPRILAHVSEDEDFRYPYLTGQDLYSTLASRVFKLVIEECGDGTMVRKMMKTGLLATMYGTSNYTLSEQLEISIDEAEQFIEDFLNSYLKVKEYIEGVHCFVDSKGYVETLFGRKRRFIGHTDIARKFHILKGRIEKILGRPFKNIWQEKEIPRKLKQDYFGIAKDYFRTLRQSVNAIIQGTGADIMKKAMIAVHNHFNSKGLDWMILATVHDELLMEVPETITPMEIEEIENIMKNAVILSVPMKVDTEIMTRWGEGIKKTDWILKGCGRKQFEK